VLCGEIEDQQHLFQCKKRAVGQEKIIAELKRKLAKTKTRPSLRDTIEKKHEALARAQGTKLKGVQAELGMYGLLRGFISKQWVDLQQKHLIATSTESKYDQGDSGQRWAAKLKTFFMATTLRSVEVE
jgi:hypothetical protein